MHSAEAVGCFIAQESSKNSLVNVKLINHHHHHHRVDIISDGLSTTEVLLIGKHAVNAALIGIA